MHNKKRLLLTGMALLMANSLVNDLSTKGLLDNIEIINEKGGFKMICERCGFSSDNKDEVAYYDINGYLTIDSDLEKADIDATAYCLCSLCSEDSENIEEE